MVNQFEFVAFLSTLDGVSVSVFTLSHGNLALFPFGERTGNVESLFLHGPSAVDDELAVLEVGSQRPFAFGNLEGFALSLERELLAEVFLEHFEVTFALGTVEVFVNGPLFGLAQLGRELEVAFALEHISEHVFLTLNSGHLCALVGFPLLEVAEHVELGGFNYLLVEARNLDGLLLEVNGHEDVAGAVEVEVLTGC